MIVLQRGPGLTQPTEPTLPLRSKLQLKLFAQSLSRFKLFCGVATTTRKTLSRPRGSKRRRSNMIFLSAVHPTMARVAAGVTTTTALRNANIGNSGVFLRIIASKVLSHSFQSIFFQNTKQKQNTVNPDIKEHGQVGFSQPASIFDSVPTNIHS